MKYLFILILAITISSCKKPDEYPIIPAISFSKILITKDAQGFDQSFSVVLDFTDGDGDIGYKQLNENGPPYDTPGSEYYNNYKGVLYHYSNGNWIAVPFSPPVEGRIPYLTPEGKNKALKGQIQFDQLVIFLPAIISEPVVNDTFRVEVFIYDRGLHKSNKVTTPNFTLNVQ